MAGKDYLRGVKHSHSIKVSERGVNKQKGAIFVGLDGQLIDAQIFHQDRM